MYLADLAQEQDINAVAEAWAPWVSSVWYAYRGEMPPIDVVMTYAYGIASGRTTPDNIIRIAQGG